MTRVTHHLNTAALHALLYSSSGPVAKDMLRRGLRVEAAAKRNLAGSPRRVDTGRLRSSIHAQLIVYNGKPAVRVGTPVTYARYVHDGTGLYGPRGALIYPIHAKALRWVGRSGGKKKGTTFVYAKFSRGMRPNHFLSDALKSAAR